MAHHVRIIGGRSAWQLADLDLSEDELRRITSDPMFLDRVAAVLPSRITEVMAAQAAYAQ